MEKRRWEQMTQRAALETPEYDRASEVKEREADLFGEFEDF